MSSITPRIYLGSAREAADRQWLRRHRITHVLNTARELENSFPDQFTYLKLPYDDHPSQNLFPAACTGARYIQAVLQIPGSKILIHCAAGISRSSSVLIHYLMRMHGMSYTQAVRYLRSRRPVVNPNPGFAHQLQA